MRSPLRFQRPFGTSLAWLAGALLLTVPGGEAAAVNTLTHYEIAELLAQLDPAQPYPGAEAEGQRGRAGTPKVPTLPYGWLDSRELEGAQRSELTEGEGDTSGG